MSATQTLPEVWKPLEKTALAQRIEAALVGGDLSKLDPSERVAYYNQVCQSLGLNPLTKPFAYITLNGKLTLYALKDCTEQLRKIHGVSICEVSSQRIDDVFVVTAKAADKAGRADCSTGAVGVSGLKGESLANALMKAETKAKRRVTLSICGLGMLDETEVDSIDARPAPSISIAPDPPDTLLDARTGEEVPASEQPEPPEGFVYLKDVNRQQSGWYRVQAGDGVIYKTKLERVGDVALQAFQQGIPVHLEGKPDARNVGEHWLDKVVTWKPEPEENESGPDHVDDGEDLPF